MKGKISSTNELSTDAPNLKLVRSRFKSIGRHHISFYLGYLEGLPLADLGDRYLESGSDLRVANMVVRWLRQELISAAGRAGDRSALRYLSASPALLNSDQSVKLSEFRKKVDPSGSFFTEKELIDLYLKEHNQDQKFNKDENVRKKALDAVRKFSAELCATDPSINDLMSASLYGPIAERMEKSFPPLLTFSDLRRRMKDRGTTWYKTVPKIGRKGALLIERWMINHEMLPKGGVVELATPSTDMEFKIAPLHRFLSPAWLEGESGTNRNIFATLEVKNDRQAIEMWLSTHTKNQHTSRCYRVCVERFFLWVNIEKEKPFCSATHEDCVDYVDFLDSLPGLKTKITNTTGNDSLLPMPEEKRMVWRWSTQAEQWVGSGRTSRDSEEWRPFNGKQSETSKRFAVTVLSAMCEWLVQQKYLLANPFAGIRKKNSGAETKENTNQQLTNTQWDMIISLCERLPEKNEAYFRMKMVLILARCTGMRLSELVSARVVVPGGGEPGFMPNKNSNGWIIGVLAKGGGIRPIPVSDNLLAALRDYMQLRGLGNDPYGWPAGTTLIVSLAKGLQHVVKERQPVSHSCLYRLLKSHLRFVASCPEANQDKGILLRASSRSMREAF